MSLAPSKDDLKRAAGRRAAELVAPDTIVGLGTGSTAKHFVDRLGERVAAGLRVRGVPTSERTAHQARECGIPLTDLNESPIVDLAVDGCDQVDPSGNLIKGLGGALIREKNVARAAREFIIIADPDKEVAVLGVGCPVPVEVRIASRADVERSLVAIGAQVTLRQAGAAAFVSDNGNWILDAHFGAIANPEELERALDAIEGVVGNGLFCAMAHRILVGEADGVREWRPWPGGAA